MPEKEQHINQLITETHQAIQGEKSKGGLMYYFTGNIRTRGRAYSKFILGIKGVYGLEDVESATTGEGFAERLEGLWAVDRVEKNPLLLPPTRRYGIRMFSESLIRSYAINTNSLKVLSQAICKKQGSGNWEQLLDRLKSARRLGLLLGTTFWNNEIALEDTRGEIERGIGVIKSLR